MERIDATSGVEGRTPAVASPWLARLPAVLFAVPVGLFGLAAAWRRAKGFGWSFAEPVGAALAWTAAALAVALVLLYAAKCLRHPRVIAVEFANPVTGSLMALIPLSLLLGTVCFGTAGQTGWLTLVALGRTAADDAQTACVEPRRSLTGHERAWKSCAEIALLRTLRRDPSSRHSGRQSIVPH